MENTGNVDKNPEDQGLSDGAPKEAANGVGVVDEADALVTATAAAKEWERKFLYLSADFENFRKRMQKERMDFLKFGHEGFLRDQLQILDNLERAVQHAKSLQPEAQSPMQQLLTGVEMTMMQFQDSLKNQGVTEMKTVDSAFDPSFHEAVGQEAADKPSGTILKELQKGYLLHGRLLRAARVIISRPKETEKDASPADEEV